jgi:hypothetical protein
MLKGVSHVHTTYSFDGKLCPAELHAFFAAKGVQFVLLSEHVESLDMSGINSLIVDCARASTDECCLVPGIEVDDLNLLIFGIRPINPYASVDELIRMFRAQGALLTYAHPIKKRKVPPWIMEIIEGFEVWNTRHDGKLMPRQRNVDLFRRLLLQNPIVRPLVGLDFHKSSDYAQAFLLVECERPCDVLATIRAGKYTLRANNHIVRVYPARRSASTLATTATGAIYTLLYDFAVLQHRWLFQHGIAVPKNLKRILKKVF